MRCRDCFVLLGLRKETKGNKSDLVSVSDAKAATPYLPPCLPPVEIYLRGKVWF